MEIKIDVGLRGVIIDCGLGYADRVKHVMGTTQCSQLVEKSGTAVHRLKMGFVGLAHIEGVEKHGAYSVCKTEYQGVCIMVVTHR